MAESAPFNVTKILLGSKILGSTALSFNNFNISAIDAEDLSKLTYDLPTAFLAPPRSLIVINYNHSSSIIPDSFSSPSECIAVSFSAACLRRFDVIYPATLFLSSLDLTIAISFILFLLSSKSTPNLSGYLSKSSLEIRFTRSIHQKHQDRGYFIFIGKGSNLLKSKIF